MSNTPTPDTPNRDLWLHELQPAIWLAHQMTKLMAEFDDRFGGEATVPYYLDGKIELVHEGEPTGAVVPNDVEEWSYRPYFMG